MAASLPVPLTPSSPPTTASLYTTTSAVEAAPVATPTAAVPASTTAEAAPVAVPTAMAMVSPPKQKREDIHGVGTSEKEEKKESAEVEAAVEKEVKAEAEVKLEAESLPLTDSFSQTSYSKIEPESEAEALPVSGRK